MIDRSNRKFFSRLSYSFGNEDPCVERKALAIKPTDRVLCITASGDRPLHLLLDDPAEITTVDLNETQSHLLALKAKAMETFGYDDYICFLGGAHDPARLEKLPLLKEGMCDKAYRFWVNHPQLVTKGVLYQGAVEKMCCRVAKALKVLRGKKIKKLFEIKAIDEQREFVKRHWNSFFWRKCFDILFNFPLMRLALKDPGVFAFLDESITPGSYLYRRLTHSLNTTLACKNPLISLILRGFVNPQAYPPYLTREGVAVIKPRLNKLTAHTDNIITFLEKSPPCHYDCFSLSDIASYMDSHNFERLLNEIQRTARPGARFSLRQFMSNHQIPASIRPYFVRDANLEAVLEAEERCFVYRFMAGIIPEGFRGSF